MKYALLSLLLTVQVGLAQDYKPQPITALLGAFDEEVKLVQQSLKDPVTKTINGLTFTSGQIGNHRVVVAETGIGKTNAAMTTAFMLAYFQPERVIFTGIAGGVNPDLQPGDIVVAKQTGYHDYHSVTFDQKPTIQTRDAISKQMNPAYFPADSVLLQKALVAVKKTDFERIPVTSRPPSIITGTVVTGDEFVNSEARVAQLRTDHKADATEMEGAAVAQVCYQLRVPCVVIRSLSDKANGNARQDMLTFYKIAARNSAKLVLAIVNSL
ncbi:5'-methylthioadenosine/S-adenosylhomocysteine nucleosidase [Spirosoma knui]